MTITQPLQIIDQDQDLLINKKKLMMSIQERQHKCWEVAEEEKVDWTMVTSQASMGSLTALTGFADTSLAHTVVMKVVALMMMLFA